MKKKSSAQCSSAGKALAECRWGHKKKKKKAKAKPKVNPRKSRRLQGQAPTRGPEPSKKPRKKAKKKAPKRGLAGKKIENILVPGMNPKKGDMASFLEQQRRLYGP